MKFPWVSRGQYDGVIAAKDEVIAVLKSDNISLHERLAAPVSVSVNLPEGFAVQMPAVVGRRKKQQDQSQHTTGATEIDWANIDENDNAAIARIAAQELGAPAAPHVLARTVTQIKMNIRTARQRKLREALTEGKVGTVSRPLTEEEAIEQEEKYVPSEIRKLVASAERW